MWDSGHGLGQHESRAEAERVRIAGAALAGVAQWIECQPAHQRITGSIPSQGMYLGCRPGPQ